jgi:hypothetical protein
VYRSPGARFGFVLRTYGWLRNCLGVLRYRPDLGRDVGLDRYDAILGHRLDRFGLRSLAQPQALHSTQSPPDGLRDQLPGNAPLDRLANAADMLVDPLAAISGFDQLLAAGDEGERAEAGDRFSAVEVPDRAKRGAEAPNFTGGMAILDVPPLGVLPERKDQFIDTGRSE